MLLACVASAVSTTWRKVSNRPSNFGRRLDFTCVGGITPHGLRRITRNKRVQKSGRNATEVVVLDRCERIKWKNVLAMMKRVPTLKVKA